VQLDTYEIVLEAQEHADALILERTANGFEPIGTLGAPPVGIFPRVLVGTWPEAGATLSLGVPDGHSQAHDERRWIALTNSLSDLELEISDSFGRVLQSRVAHLDFKRDAPLGDLLIEVQFLDRKAALYRRDSGELACLIFGPSRYDIQEDPLGRDVLGFSGPPYFLFGEAADDDRTLHERVPRAGGTDRCRRIDRADLDADQKPDGGGSRPDVAGTERILHRWRGQHEHLHGGP